MNDKTWLKDIVMDLVAANHIRGAENVTDSFGHISARHPNDPERYVVARAIPLKLVTVEDFMEIALSD